MHDVSFYNIRQAVTRGALTLPPPPPLPHCNPVSLSPQVDCTIFGHLSQIVYPDMPYPQKDFIQTHCPNLVAYMERIQSLYWPDWDQLVDTGTFE